MKFDINELIGNLTPQEGLDKQASVIETPATPSVAEELRSVLMVKSASVVAAEAGDLGRQLARRLMEKAASETPMVVSEVVSGDQLSSLTALVESTLIKEAGESQPNIANADNAALAVAQSQVDAAATQSGGTVEAQTAESLQKGFATTSAQASSEDLARKVEDKAEDANMQKAAAVHELVGQGHSFYDAAELVAMADSELQKEAAFEALTAEGYSFDDATSLVKAAGDMGFVIGSELDKQAALGELIAEGYNFDDAVEMVKEAGLAEIAGKVAGIGRGAVGAVKAEGSKLGADASRYAQLDRKSVV